MSLTINDTDNKSSFAQVVRNVEMTKNPPIFFVRMVEYMKM